MAEDGEKATPHVTIDGNEVSRVLNSPDLDKLAEKAIANWAVERAAAMRAAVREPERKLGPKDHKRY